MRIKRLLSIILCLVFVMSLFSFSVSAKSSSFVEEDEDQHNSVSEDVYAEQGNDIDNGIYDDVSLDDMLIEDEPDTPAITPAGANIIQMMAIDDNGEDPPISEDPPIMGVSDLKTSYEFAEVTGTFEVIFPKEGEEGEYNYEYCEVSFTPIIEEGETPFYIANGLYGKEAVFTIRDSDVDVRAAINIEDIYIEKPDLVEAGEPRITVSEDDEIFYSIIFEVDFYSLKVSDERIGTLRSEVQVYDSPSIGIDVDYEGQITSHDDEY